MPALFNCRDRKGLDIRLEEETWRDKILAQRPWLANQQYLVEVAVREPDFVNQDRDYPNRRAYYKRGLLPPPEDQDYLKVVVEVERSLVPPRRSGKVITAYPTDRAKDGEQELWR